MKILQSHLSQFIKIPENILELTNAYITEVDEFKKMVEASNIVVGYVLEREKHENADTLSVTKVNLGDTIEQIVCGAPNVAAGQYVIVAKPGAVLPGNFAIKPSKIRGVESNGMICSLRELGFDEDIIPEQYKHGIYVFNEPQVIGSNPLLPLLVDGFSMELGLTPNRSDLLSHYGFARDLSAVLNTNIELPKFEIKEINKKNPISVKIESKNTNSYYARFFEDVEIKESPFWLKAYLSEIGTQPINNVVDITNYILFTYGIPMHAFDADKFSSKTVVVKDNDKEQTVKTLDGNEIKITKDEILITNGRDIMALGGIMGLDNSKITDETKAVILEVASFDKETTRNSSKKLGLKSDSSLRFERGIDENIMMQALNHATYLFETLANAKVYEGISSDIVKKFNNPVIKVSLSDVKNMIGSDITSDDIINILKRLNYEIENKDSDILNVKAPSYRHDINIFADVVEEIVRIYGMDKITNKPLIDTSSKGLSKKQAKIRKLRNYLSSIGLNEVINYSLIKEEEIDKYNNIGEKISLLKPMTSDRNSLRQSLFNGLVETKRYNNSRQINNVNIFEIGKVYAKDIEDLYLGVLVTSNTYFNTWKKTNDKIDFYYLSGILANIMNILGATYELKSSNFDYLHPYQQAVIIVNKETVGVIGKLHPRDHKDDTFVFEINLDKLDGNSKTNYEPISKYPNVERDIAFVISNDIKVGDVLEVIKQTAKKLLVNIELFDIYQGEHIKEGYKSVAVSLVFNDKQKTLESTEVDKLVLKIVKRLEFEFKAEIRE